MKDLKRCPVCGGCEIKQGKQVGNARMIPVGKLFRSGCEILADICTDCGHILSMKVVKPGLFK